MQAVLPNGREFDIFDVVANIVGSLAGLGLCSWYHKRMLERKRLRKYTAVPTAGDAGGEDLELGEGPGLGGGGGVVSGNEHEEGVIGSSAAVSDGQRATTLEQEVDNWDENAVDAWDEDELGDVGVSVPSGSDANGEQGKKRSD